MLATISLFQAYYHSDLFGKMIFLFLFLLSVTCWTLIILLFRKTWQTKKKAKFFSQKILSLTDKVFAQPIDNSGHPFSLLYKEIRSKTTEILEKNKFFSEDRKKVFLSSSDLSLLESHTRNVMMQMLRKMEKHLFILPTIYTLAPFLGLLGTVWGILITFSHIAAGQSIAGNSLILSGLSMALATTVVGLLVAIPALIGYNFLKSEIEDFKKKMIHFAQTLLYHLEMQYRKVD